MSLSIDSLLSNYSTNTSYSATQSKDLTSKINNTDTANATDEELMSVCKNFESYFVEQVIKEMKKTVHDSDMDNSEYMQYFGDVLNQTYAEDITKNDSLGLAKTLYESMKRSQ